MNFIFPLILGLCHHPNWLSYFSEGWPNHQPDEHQWTCRSSSLDVVFLPLLRLYHHLLTGKSMKYGVAKGDSGCEKVRSVGSSNMFFFLNNNIWCPTMLIYHFTIWLEYIKCFLMHIPNHGLHNNIWYPMQNTCSWLFMTMLIYRTSPHRWTFRKMVKPARHGGSPIISWMVFVKKILKKNWIWLVVWLPWILFSHWYWECHHPNWLSYFSEGWPNHQPGMIWWYLHFRKPPCWIYTWMFPSSPRMILITVSLYHKTIP